MIQAVRAGAQGRLGAFGGFAGETQIGSARNNELLLSRLAGDKTAAPAYRIGGAGAPSRRIAAAAGRRWRMARRDPRAPRSENGFGYDPLFYLSISEQTAAELGPRSATLSHCGAACTTRSTGSGSIRSNERTPCYAGEPNRAPQAPPSSLRTATAVAARALPVTRPGSACDFRFARGARRGHSRSLRQALIADLEAALPQIWGGGSTQFSSAEARPA